MFSRARDPENGHDIGHDFDRAANLANGFTDVVVGRSDVGVVAVVTVLGVVAVLGVAITVVSVVQVVSVGYGP